MTNEEMQRTMEFIVEHQAQFAASIQRLQEEHERLEAERLRDGPRLTRLEESFQLLVQLAQATDSRLDSVEARLDEDESRLDNDESRLDQGESRLDQDESRLDKGEVKMSLLEENMAALAVAQAHADERLSALIDIVREGRNGRS